MKGKLLVTAALFLLVAGAALWVYFGASSSRNAPAASASRARRSVAVRGFKNASGSSETAWFSTALSEMLNTDLAAGEKLRVVSGENVARTKVNLSLAEAETYARDTLERIRSNLDVEFIILGSYVALGEKGGRRIRLDLRLQDAAAGETIASVAETGSESELFDLVSRVGSTLREKLGAGGRSGAEALAVRTSLPSNPEAAPLYAEGLSKLRGFDYLGARHALERAVELEPKHPLSHWALSEACSSLGYNRKAEDEAKKAFDLSADLPREERLSIEARYRETTEDWDKAIEIHRSLWTFFPDNVDYGLRLAAAQLRADNQNDSMATVDSIVASSKVDARIDVAEAEAAGGLSDYRRQQTAARRGAEKAEAQGARLVLAWALLQEGSALGDLGSRKEAVSVYERARQIFEASGDSSGVAKALRDTAWALLEDDPARAKKAFEQSLDVSRRMGAKPDVAAALEQFNRSLRRAGEFDTAENNLDEALAIWREIGDVRDIARNLQHRASLHSDRGDLKKAQAAHEETIGILQKSYPTLARYPLFNMASGVLFQRGDLEGARLRFEEALALDRSTGGRRDVALDIQIIGVVLAEQGELSEARRKGEEALAICRELDDKRGMAEAQYLLGDVLTKQSELVDAKRYFEAALSLYRELDLDVLAAVLLGRIGDTLLQQGRVPEGKKMLAEAGRTARDALTPGTGTRGDLHDLLQILEAYGAFQEARTLLEQQLAILRSSDNRRYLALPLSRLADLSFDEGSLADAKKLYEEARETERRIEALGGETDALSKIVRVSTAEGDLSKARSLHERALRMKEELGRDGDAAYSRLDLALLALEENRRTEAETMARKGLDYFGPGKSVRGRADDADRFFVIACSPCGCFFKRETMLVEVRDRFVNVPGEHIIVYTLILWT